MAKKLSSEIFFAIGTKYTGKEVQKNSICCNCGKKFTFDVEHCEIYRNKTLCSKCLELHYGYCNECGELNRYIDMNEDIVCGGCRK